MTKMGIQGNGWAYFPCALRRVHWVALLYTTLFFSEPIENVFYLDEAMFEIQM